MEERRPPSLLAKQRVKEQVNEGASELRVKRDSPQASLLKGVTLFSSLLLKLSEQQAFEGGASRAYSSAINGKRKTRKDFFFITYVTGRKGVAFDKTSSLLNEMLSSL